MSELGTKLRDARIEKGYTLNTLQQMTKIQKKYLVAIEEGRFEEIPGNFYTRAFVKQYADMVGLDGDSLLLDYQSELEAVEHGLSQYEEQETEAMPSRLNRNQAQSEQSLLDRYAKHLPVLMLAGVFILVMAFITWTIYSVSQRERQQQANSSSATSLVSSVEPSSAAQHAASSSSETSSQAKIDGAEFFGDVQAKRVSGEGEETTYELYAPMNKFKFTVKGKNYVWVGVYED
ncbi:MAG: helix-turn-helix domain-containing protein, partial [Abiotrophia defectiva]